MKFSTSTKLSGVHEKYVFSIGEIEEGSLLPLALDILLRPAVVRNKLFERCFFLSVPAHIDISHSSAAYHHYYSQNDNSCLARNIARRILGQKDVSTHDGTDAKGE